MYMQLCDNDIIAEKRGLCKSFSVESCRTGQKICVFLSEKELVRQSCAGLLFCGRTESKKKICIKLFSFFIENATISPWLLSAQRRAASKYGKGR